MVDCFYFQFVPGVNFAIQDDVCLHYTAVGGLYTESIVRIPSNDVVADLGIAALISIYSRDLEPNTGVSVSQKNYQLPIPLH